MAGMLGIQGFKDLSEAEKVVAVSLAAEAEITLYHDGILDICCQNSITKTGLKRAVDSINLALKARRNGNGDGKSLIAAEFFGRDSFFEI